MDKSEKKKKRRWWRWLWRSLLGIFLCFVLAFYIVSSTSFGKRWLTHQIENLANKYVFEHIEIGLVELEFPLKLNLSNVVIYDHRDSVLLSAQTIKAQARVRPLLDSNLILRDVVISNFHVNMAKYDGDESFNYRYALKEQNSSNSKSPINSFLVQSVILDGGDFHYHYYGRERVDKSWRRIDYNHIVTNNLSGRIDSITSDTSTRMHVAFLSCKEASGFDLQNLTTDLTISDQSFIFNNTSISTGNKTMVDIDYAMRFNSWDDFDDFENSVNIKSEIRQSELNIDDLKFFTSSLGMLENNLGVSGDFKGVINAFWVNDFYLRFDNQHFAKGDLRISDVTEPESIFIDLKLSESLVEADLIRRYYRDFTVPKALDDLGQIDTKGQFTGVLNNFVAYAKFKTALGNVDSDIHLELSENDINNKYSGKLDLADFNLGKLVDNNTLGQVSFQSMIEGRGLTLQYLSNKIEANVDYIDLNNYRYQDLMIDGKTADKSFTGTLEMRDTNANLDFNGTINFNKNRPEYRFITNIAYANLSKLNWVDDEVQLSGNFNFNFKAKELEDLVGTFRAEKGKLTFNDAVYDLSNAELEAKKLGDVKYWDLKSNMVTGHLYINRLLNDVPDVLLTSATQMLKQNKFAYQGKSRDGFMDFELNVIDSKPLIRLWGEDLEIESGTKVVGYLDQENDYFNIKLNGKYVRFQDLAFNNFTIDVVTQFGLVDGEISLEQFQMKDDTLVSNYALKLNGTDSLLMSHHTADISHGFARADIYLGVDLISNDSNQLYIDSSTISLEESVFGIEANQIQWLGIDLFNFDSLSIFAERQEMRLSGYVNTNGTYKINSHIQGLQLVEFSHYLGEYFETMKGNINGSIAANNESGDHVIESNIQIDSLDFKDLNLNHAQISTSYNNVTGMLALKSELSDVDSNIIASAKGQIPYDDNGKFGMGINLEKVPLSMFQPLLTDIVSDINGTITGVAELSGKLNDPFVNGYASLDSAVFTVDYLNTRYGLNQTLHFDNNRIKFNQVELTDVRGEKSFINGFVSLNNFSTFDLNLAVESKNFQMLNTSEDNYELYYGTAYITGNSKFTGSLLSTHMKLDLKTEAGTKLFLPIEEETGYTQQSFIHFINTQDSTVNPEKNSSNDNDDFSMDMNLQLTDVAEVQLIFDKQMGDVIKANGNGNINMLLSPGGDFEMFGDYIIESGNYLFTAFDLINKRFKVKQGSKVSWVGDPYDALIDIMAYYELKANAYMLISALDNVSSEKLSSTTVPVLAQASLKGSLLKPEVKLGFELVSNGLTDVSTIQRELNALNLSQEEIDKQVVSLLVLNRFMPVYTGSGNGGNAFNSGYQASLGDFVSNQVTNWLSTIDEDLSVNFTYSGELYSGNREFVLSRNELELALSYSFFNDRVQVNSSYEFNNNYRPNTEVSYKANKDGSLRLKLFNRQSQNPLITQDTKTYGFGVFFRREFNSIKELFQPKNKKKETIE